MKYLIVLSFLIFSACAHSIHDVYVSDFGNYPHLDQGEIIRARSEQFSIMGFVGNTDYVEEAERKLVAQCPNGSITGISSQYSTSLGFFSWTHKILMQGLCTKSAQQARN